jgi:hypothetical protein
MIVDCKYMTVPFESAVFNVESDPFSAGDYRLIASVGGEKFALKSRMSWSEAKWELRGIVDAYERGEKIYEF